MRRISAAMAVGVLAILGACASGGPPSPPMLAGTISATSGLNPDVNGRPSPVSLRIYQLRAAGGFGGADFFSLYRDASSVLAADLVSSEERLVKPGETTTYTLELDPDTRHIGVVAGFRDVGNAQWRSELALPEENLDKYLKRHRLLIALEDLSVSVVAAGP